MRKSTMTENVETEILSHNYEMLKLWDSQPRHTKIMVIIDFLNWDKMFKLLQCKKINKLWLIIIIIVT